MGESRTPALVGAVIASLAASLAGCRSEPRQPPPPPLPPQASFVGIVGTTLASMHTSFASAKRIEQAVARGDLAQARAEAAMLAATEEPDALPRWQPYFERVRLAAGRIEASTTLAAASQTTAELGNACADCHEDVGGRPSFAPEAHPSAGGPAISPQMRDHQWATARMWEGLIGPDNGRWLDGAEALSHAPMTLTEADQNRLGTDRDRAADRAAVDQYVVRMRGFAERAMVPLYQAQRTELFGEMLATCAGCHALVRAPAVPAP